MRLCDERDGAAGTREAPRVHREVGEKRDPRFLARIDDVIGLAVRDVVHGLPVKNLEALANPEVLEQFRDRPELRA